jgi:hypothetical protein
MNHIGREQEKCVSSDPDADLRDRVKEFCRLHRLRIDTKDSIAMAKWAADLKEARAKIEASIPLTEWGAMAIEIICTRKRQ